MHKDSSSDTVTDWDIQYLIYTISWTPVWTQHPRKPSSRSQCDQTERYLPIVPQTAQTLGKGRLSTKWKWEMLRCRAGTDSAQMASTLAIQWLLWQFSFTSHRLLASWGGESQSVADTDSQSRLSEGNMRPGSEGIPQRICNVNLSYSCIRNQGEKILAGIK